jgi:iron-sulfur cluster assembly protein
MSSTPATKAERNEAQAPQKVPDAASVRNRAKPAPEGQGIHLTDVAASKIREIIKAGNHPDTMYLFVGVKGGGCSGLQYVLDLRDEAHAPVAETDEIFEAHGIPVVCDLKSYVVGNLTGTTIDYQEGLMGAGFTFNNPNAKHSCGCGSSYSA